jgi:hydrogenase-4 membrane subunit HyfE
METIIFVALTVSTLATALGCVGRDTRETILFLSMQASTIGFVELLYCLFDLIIGLHIEALIDFFATFAEWFSCAVASPLIIYWGMVKTENNTDQPVIGTRNTAILLAIMTLFYWILGTWILSPLPSKFEAIPFSAFMFSMSVFLMSTRKDALKILAGLNMAENALYPLIAEIPLGLIPFMLVLMVFVNIVGVFIIMEAYREYKTLKITEWKCMG